MKSSINVKANQQGFTLIELVVVIVILGVLAVTAAPKFINLQSDARTATLQAVKASMQTVSTLVHSKSLIEGNEKLAAATTVFVTVNGKKTEITFGYPLADYSSSHTDNPGDWSDLLEIAADFSSVVINTKFYVYPSDVTAPTSTTVSNSTANCYVAYTKASSGVLPTYVVTDCI